MITYQFHKSESRIGKIIQFFSRFLNFQGNWDWVIPNHVSIRTPKFVYEAHLKSGVHKVPVKQFDTSSVVFCVETKWNEKECIKFLEAQIGKKYDKLWIVSFLWRFIKQGKSKWFCSEMAMVALAKEWKITYYNQRISPIEFLIYLLR